MDRSNERIAQLEQRLAQMEDEVGRTRREMHALRRGARRSRWGTRVAQTVGLCGAIALIGVSTVGATAVARGPQPLTVKAPFKVLGNSGQPFMGVDTAGVLTIYGQARRPVVVLGPSEDAYGVVQVLNGGSGEPVAGLTSHLNGTGELAVVGDEGEIARLGVLADVANQLSLRFYQGATVRAKVGAGKAGLLEINNATGQKMVLLGENGKSGTVAVYDTAGQNKILLATDPATGDAELDLLYGDRRPAVQLSEVARGGYFALTNTAGIARVEAGTLATDQGIVRVFGPGGFDYIRGRK